MQSASTLSKAMERASPSPAPKTSIPQSDARHADTAKPFQQTALMVLEATVKLPHFLNRARVALALMAADTPTTTPGTKTRENGGHGRKVKESAGHGGVVGTATRAKVVPGGAEVPARSIQMQDFLVNRAQTVPNATKYREKRFAWHADALARNACSPRMPKWKSWIMALPVNDAPAPFSITGNFVLPLQAFCHAPTGRTAVAQSAR